MTKSSSQSHEMPRRGRNPTLAGRGGAHGGDEGGPAGGRTGPVPEDNQPGHHPTVEQDRPDPDAFVERFTHPGHESDEAAEPAPEPRVVAERPARQEPAAASAVEAPAVGDEAVVAASGHRIARSALSFLAIPVNALRSVTAAVLRGAAHLIEPSRH